jgi:hypothetical protein
MMFQGPPITIITTPPDLLCVCMTVAGPLPVSQQLQMNYELVYVLLRSALSRIIRPFL